MNRFPGDYIVAFSEEKFVPFFIANKKAGGSLLFTLQIPYKFLYLPITPILIYKTTNNLSQFIYP